MNYELTNDEIVAIERYQDNDFKIMNTLLREGIESEIRINSSKGKDYPFMTRDLMEQSLNDIQNLYSAIIKSYIKNGQQKPNMKLYRGTNQSLVNAMNNKNSSFLSATLNINQTITFSRIFRKEATAADESDKALLLINSNVPWINIEDEIGGFEGEVLFVPSKMEIIENNLSSNSKYGKEYIVNLVEIEIPEKTSEEIQQMKTQILSSTEKMSEYLKYILVVKDNPNFNNNPRTLKIIKEYEDWKKLVIEYNHQQYRIIKTKLLNNQKDDILSSKVEKDYVAEEFINPKKLELYSLKKRIEQIKEEDKELFDLDSVFTKNENIDEIDNESIEHAEGKVM